MTLFVRFIYVYRLKATGRAVYVGSAFNPEKRDVEHCRGLLPFDKELQRRGRDAFTFHIVEALSAPTAFAAEKVSYSRENHWMDVEKTFRTKGCFNFGRSRCHSSKETREAAIVARTAGIIRSRTPEVIARIRASAKLTNALPETRARRSAAARATQAKPEVRANVSAGVRRACSSPAFLKKRGDAIREGRSKNPTLFLESTRRAQKARSEQHRKEQLALAKILAQHGDLPSKAWMKRNGYASLAWTIGQAPDLFSAFVVADGNRGEHHRATHELALEKHVTVAKELAANNGGFLPGGKWLNEHGYSGLSLAYSRWPDAFAGIKRDSRSNIYKARWAGAGNESRRNRVRECQRNKQVSEETRLKQRIAAQNRSEETLQKMSEAQKKRCADPAVRAQMSANGKKHYENPEARARNREAQNRPDVQARRAASIKEKLSHPEVRARCSAAQAETWKRADVRSRRIEGIKRASSTSAALS